MGLVLECNKSIDVGALVVRTDIRGVELVGVVLVGAAPRALGAIGSCSASIACLCGTTQSGKALGPRDIRGISGSKTSCFICAVCTSEIRNTGKSSLGEVAKLTVREGLDGNLLMGAVLSVEHEDEGFLGTAPVVIV